MLAALAHPGHIVTYASGDSLPCRRDAIILLSYYFVIKNSLPLNPGQAESIRIFLLPDKP
ncbi:hypothetical protein CKY10_21225 [Photorhabdus sp. HUG-39]|nr:hypothetical protein CKY10_21225 [Photorhabdus sp. HUG-39]